ncbi:helix-turn-helix transcriptional regulator [Streptomyces sp. NPDC001508]|uniref:helix-turn-helix domain-containing protein n=1 Tax=Streptomyces sp. NPDC001508 TaxID=3154656 RepID=UPI00332FF37F
MTEPLDAYQQARLSALGLRLRDLREKAGVSARAVAARADINQSTMSRIETGRIRPSAEVLGRIIAALDLDQAAADELHDLLGVLHTETEHLRRYARRGFGALQARIGALERHTRLVRSFQPSTVPGLLQTAEYAAQALGKVYYASSTDLARAAHARMERQTILHEPGREFRYVLTEAALLHWVCPARVMLAQIDRIRELATLPTVRLGILRQDRAMPTFPQHGFTLFDDERAHIELHTTHLKLTAPKDVAVYIATFAEYERAAVYGEEAEMVLRRVMQEYRRRADDA